MKKMVKLDPEEYCAFVWPTEEDVRMSRCKEVLFKWTNNRKKDMILKGFKAMKVSKKEKGTYISDDRLLENLFD
jgi:hypothetical protein